MNIGALASLLGKEEKEFLEVHKLEGDLTLESVESILKSELPNWKKKLITEAKDEAYGRATKEQFTKVEKQLSDRFGITSTGDFAKVLDELESKIQPPKGNDDAIEKVKRDAEIWKEKFNALNTDFGKYKETIEFEGKKNKVVSKLNSVLPETFDVKSDKLKELAMNQFLSDYNFDLIDNDVQLFQGDKPIFKPFEDVAKEYFKEYFPTKENGKSKAYHTTEYVRSGSYTQE
jgi:hypothetical protein